jgi:putative ABC transport system ATP-binding protein
MTPVAGDGVAVSCRAIQKHYGEGDTRVEALRGVDFSASAGELSFLVGPSGCGKTTLLSVIAGILDPSGGDLTVLGVRIDRLSERDRILFRRKNLGFVFQQYNLLPALTAAENVAVPLLAAGARRDQALERAASLLARLGLEARAAALPSTLSGGQQQRVAIARALVHEPRLVVCDEPTAALDHESGEAVMELLAANVVRPDRAVIVVTHDSRVLHHAHSISRMDDGRVVGTTRPNGASQVSDLTARRAAMEGSP